jgi:hypothetical protein
LFQQTKQNVAAGGGEVDEVVTSPSFSLSKGRGSGALFLLQTNYLPNQLLCSGEQNSTIMLLIVISKKLGLCVVPLLEERLGEAAHHFSTKLLLIIDPN